MCGDFIWKRVYAGEVLDEPQSEPKNPRSPGGRVLIWFAWFVSVAAFVLKVVPVRLLDSYLVQPDSNGWMIVILGPAIPVWLAVVACAVIASMIMSLILVSRGRMMHGLLTLGITALTIFVPSV